MTTVAQFEYILKGENELKIIYITINNYKSIGNYKNTLYLDPGTTALIGKNESGKSNILDAIGNLPYFDKPNKTYYKYKKRSANDSGDSITVVIGLQLDEKEIEGYVANSLTKLTFKQGSTVSIEGGLSELIANDTELFSNIDKLIKTKGNKKIWNISNNENNKKQHILIMDSLKNCSEVFLLNFEQGIKKLKQILLKSDQYDELFNTLDKIHFCLSRYYKILPKIFFREHDHQLEYSYDYEGIKEILKYKNDILYQLLLAASISEQEILNAFEEKIEGNKQNIRLEIEEKISNNIGVKFNEFYSQETVKFKPRFEGNLIKFLVHTNKGKTMQITERSNGLRWYLSLFIDILANNLSNSQVLFLFDEPGVHLHVNAQKELLNLFEDLSKKGHQVIYTTHSPSMIDSENILNVRAVEKNDCGNTIIYKSGYDQRLSVESKMETLSPLIKAIGSDLKFNLGPHYSKLNIITEGITDYMYIKALMYYLNVKEPPNIIPSAGVENINRISSILLGWGCEFKILLDYDNAGGKEYNVLTEKLDPSLKEKITFVNGENHPSTNDMKSSPIRIEDLISEKDFNKLTIALNENGDNKVLVAKEFYDKVVNNEMQLDEKTVDTFKRVLNKLEIISY